MLFKSFSQAIFISLVVFVVLLMIGFEGSFFGSIIVFLMAFLELFGARW
ncbi:MAG: hypothetical protein NUV57_03400 [archaeon]|nr:hypothetical protein [archaeon]